MSIFTKSISAIAGRAKITGFLVGLLVLALACTPVDQQLIEGILQNVDSANGEITIVTKDGKTVTLTISTDATVDTEGTLSSFETLEAGASIEVSVTDDGEQATKISARQSKVRGTITSVIGNEVSIMAENGIAFVVIVDESTRIKLEEDSRGSLADILVGAEIEAKFDPETGIAFKLDLEQEEAEIEGLATIEGNQVTIQTEKGRILTVTVGDDTRIELADGSVGTLADLVDGLKIEADFDPSSLSAFKIEIEHDEGDEDEDDGNKEDRARDGGGENDDGEVAGDGDDDGDEDDQDEDDQDEDDKDDGRS